MVATRREYLKAKAESVRKLRGRQLVACALLGGVLLVGCGEDDPTKTIEVGLGESGSVSDWLDVAIREAVSECESNDSLEEVRFTFMRDELESGIAREYYIGNFPGGITCQSVRPGSTTTGPDGETTDTTEAEGDDESTATTEASESDEEPTTTTEADADTDDESTATTEASDSDAEDEATTTTEG